MATLRLPVFASNLDHKYNIVLDGVSMIIEFHYNKRSDKWTVHLFDIENTPIRHGIRLVLGIDLMQRIALVLQPPGELRVVDDSGEDIEPSLTTLGVESDFRYVEFA